ncbi:MAG TPA: nuclear transport factor 2 family protein [Acidobacteriaceae bacterium]|nr:nuclear transport factor 2 family protein [Acidobacteriaceae bacterium]
METVAFPLQSSFVHSFAHEWIDAWNSHDLERILSHYSADVTLISPVALQRLGNSTVQGKTALRGYFRGGLEKYPDFRFDPGDVFWGVDTVALLYSSSFRTARTVEVMQLSSSGLVFRVWANYDE